MKKGLRNSLAMGALALTNLFGGIRPANAEGMPEPVVEEAKIVEMAKVLKQNTSTSEPNYKTMSKELFQIKQRIAKFLRKPVYVGGIGTFQEVIANGESVEAHQHRLRQVKELKKYLNTDGEIDFSRCKTIMVIESDVFGKNALFAVNYGEHETDDAFLLEETENGLRMSYRQIDSVVSEGDGRRVTVIPEDGTFMVQWDDNGHTTKSPLMEYDEMESRDLTEKGLSVIKKDVQGLMKTPLKMGGTLTPMSKEGDAIGPDDFLGGLGKHLSSWGRANLKERSENLKKFLVKGPDGKMQVDLSRCKSVLAAYNMDGDLTYLALNYQRGDTSPKDGVLLQYNSNDGSVSLTDQDDGTVLLEVATDWVIINPAKKSFKVEMGGKHSSEMSYTSEKTKTVAPAVKKAISERLQKN